jgi:hypothetical protein
VAGECVAQAASKESLTWCNGAGPANSGPLLCTQRIKAADASPRYAEYDSDVTVEYRVARGAEARYATMSVRESLPYFLYVAEIFDLLPPLAKRALAAAPPSREATSALDGSDVLSSSTVP